MNGWRGGANEVDVQLNHYEKLTGKYFSRKAVAEGVFCLAAADCTRANIDDASADILLSELLHGCQQGLWKKGFEDISSNKSWHGIEIFLIRIAEGKLFWFATGSMRLYLYRKGSLGRLTTENVETIKSSWENANSNDIQSSNERRPNNYYAENIIGGIGVIYDLLHCIDANTKAFTLLPGDSLFLCSKDIYLARQDEELEYVFDNINTESGAKICEVILHSMQNEVQGSFLAHIIKVEEKNEVTEKEAAEDIIPEMNTDMPYNKDYGKRRKGVVFWAVVITAVIVILAGFFWWQHKDVDNSADNQSKPAVNVTTEPNGNENKEK